MQRIRTFEEAVRHRVRIAARCHSCSKSAVYRAMDFLGYIRPGAEITSLRWRCSWCKNANAYVRYCPLDDLNREAVAQWTPPAGMRKKW